MSEHHHSRVWCTSCVMRDKVLGFSNPSCYLASVDYLVYCCRHPVTGVVRRRRIDSTLFHSLVYDENTRLQHQMNGLFKASAVAIDSQVLQGKCDLVPLSSPASSSTKPPTTPTVPSILRRPARAKRAPSQNAERRDDTTSGKSKKQSLTRASRLRRSPLS